MKVSIVSMKCELLFYYMIQMYWKWVDESASACILSTDVSLQPDVCLVCVDPLSARVRTAGVRPETDHEDRPAGEWSPAQAHKETLSLQIRPNSTWRDPIELCVTRRPESALIRGLRAVLLLPT